MILSHLTDFSDRLSPMLVKELRQGLRAKTFIMVFLSLQILLSIMLLSASASGASDQAGSVVSSMIFIFFAIAVLVVQPMRGVAALASEIKSNTIDMMVLTRLSAWRIVYGKWVAIISQSALILVTIVPYLILRYFFGGMNLVGEIVFLGLIFLTSMALTAVTVGLSGSASAVIRALIPLFGIPLLFISMIGFAFGRGSNNIIEVCSLETVESVVGILFYVISIMYLGWSALTLGASLIAPAAENHSTIRRCITLLLLIGLIPVVLYSSIEKEVIAMLGLVLVIPALVTALTETTLILPIQRLRFIKNRFLRSVGSLFLQPGLAGGIIFSVLLITMVVGIAWVHPQNSSKNEVLITILALIGTLLLPAVIQNFTFKSDGQRVANYFLILIGLGILSIIVGTLSGVTSNDSILWLFIWNPLTFLIMANQSEFSDSNLFVGVLIVVAIFLTLLLFQAFQLMKVQREMIQHSEANP